MLELYQHSFQPWTADGESRVLAAAEHWAEPETWNAASGDRQRIAVMYSSGEFTHYPLPRVHVVPDVFEDFYGDITDDTGSHLRHCNDCGFVGTVEAVSGSDHKRANPTDRSVCDMWFHSRSLEMSDVRNDLFNVTDATPNLDYMIETRHPENVAAMWPDREAKNLADITVGELDHFNPQLFHRRHNVMLGVHVTTQAEWDRLVPELLKCADLVKTLFVVLDPREAIDVRPALRFRGEDCLRIEWLIVQGNTEPMHPDHVRSIRDQCAAAGVPWFFAGWGNWRPGRLDGVEWTETPE